MTRLAKPTCAASRAVFDSTSKFYSPKNFRKPRDTALLCDPVRSSQLNADRFSHVHITELRKDCQLAPFSTRETAKTLEIILAEIDENPLEMFSPQNMNLKHCFRKLSLLISNLIIVHALAFVQAKDKEIYFAASRATSNENGVLTFKNETATSRTYGKYDVSVENGGWVPKASIDQANNAPTMVSQDYRRWIGDINAATKKKKVLVYVHGFRNSFIDAVESAAILSEPMETVVPIVYSWPASKESPTRARDALKVILSDYHQAEDVKEESAKDLKAFLNSLGDEFGPENVSVVAHSFGNSVTLSALKDGDIPVRIRNLIMIAPDVRRDEFVKTREEVEGKVGRVSIYFAEDDLVLKGSTVRDSRRWANGSLGNQRPGTLFNSEKTDVIDSSFMCFTFGGHSYHTSNRRVRDDITNLVDRYKNASSRKSELEEKGTGSNRWFAFKKKERIKEAENRKNLIRATGPIAAVLGSLFK